MGPASVDSTAAWVAKVNALAAEVDETAASLHPSAWQEQLAGLHDRYRRLAASGPPEVIENEEANQLHLF